MLPLDPEAVSITDEAANVDDNRSAYEPVQRNLVNLFPVFVEVERRVDVGARVSAEAEGVNAASVSFRELDGRLGGEFGVLWVRGDIGFEGVSQVYDFGHLSGLRCLRPWTVTRSGPLSDRPNKEVQSLCNRPSCSKFTNIEFPALRPSVPHPQHTSEALCPDVG